MTENRLFTFGLGYSAQVLADMLRAEGWEVSGTCRSPAKQAQLKEQKINAFLFDNNKSADISTAIRSSTHILISVPPDAKGDTVLRHYREELAALSGCRWIGYLSTTGVYGDAAGNWVDEGSPLNPDSARQQWRMEAEREWMELYTQHGQSVHIFRLAGIYGPGRSALEQVREGKARRIDKSNQYFSRIHVEDIAHALRASMMHPTPGEAYNVCDDMPSSAGEVVAYACHIMGKEPPPPVPFAEAELSEMVRSFYSCSRRVRNDKLKQRLGVVLRYPDYKTGLDALWRDMQT